MVYNNTRVSLPQGTLTGARIGVSSPQSDNSLAGLKILIVNMSVLCKEYAEEYSQLKTNLPAECMHIQMISEAKCSKRPCGFYRRKKKLHF